jgi:hypothetical protein
LDTHGGFVFVLRSLASGAITSEMRYGRIGIRHHTPPPPGPQPPAREATFSTDEVGDSIRLLRAGCTEPLATVTNGADVNIAPDGQSAFVCVDVGSQSRTVLFTAAHAEGRLLCDHWANDPVWLRIGDTTNLWRGASSRCKVIPSEPCGTH